MMETELIGKFNLGDGWQCYCGKVYFLAGYYFEKHWTDEIKFKCSRCETRYTLSQGELTAAKPVPEFAESPY